MSGSSSSTTTTPIALAFTVITVMGWKVYLSFQNEHKKTERKPKTTKSTNISINSSPIQNTTSTVTTTTTNSNSSYSSSEDVTNTSEKTKTEVDTPNDDSNNDDSNDDSVVNNHTIKSATNRIPVPKEIETSEYMTQASTLLRIQTPDTITIAYASTTGTCGSFAETLRSDLSTNLLGNSGSSSTTIPKIQVCTVDELDWWDEILNNETETTEEEQEDNSLKTTCPPIVIFILPTWTNGTLPTKYATLLTSLDEISHDWRVAPKPLRINNNDEDGSKKKTKQTTPQRHWNDRTTLQIASFGMGSTAYDIATFCKPAKNVFSYFMKLGARSLLTSHGKSVVGTGDDESGDCREEFRLWTDRVLKRVESLYNGSSSSNKETTRVVGSRRKGGNVAAVHNSDVNSTCCSNNKGESTEEKKVVVECCRQDENSSSGDGGCGCTSDESNQVAKVEESLTCQSNTGASTMQTVNEEDEYCDTDSEWESEEDDEDDDWDEEKEEPEVMDLEDIGNAMHASKTTTTNNKKEVKEMVTPKQAAALKKEGYKIIGTHSAVKLCRWTKHQLRGRGGCYKHTFYGITSYQCMEATPSLACANKCVFCWRHHKNPVGREWRWKADDPVSIVSEAVQTHVAMIKETKGIPGVLHSRWLEAHTVRHCALSLVGEPIMYPQINELLDELHKRDISTYLVTNGQHPKAIQTLRPITQLYVSVDASTPETLDAIDRPLFKDAWDRLKLSLKLLKNKGQRTVARLTVVKGWNSDEVEGYAKLIALGHCSFVEVKGVTFCGKSDASNLNMSNSPWHHEVVALTQNLQKALLNLRNEQMSYDDNEDNRIPEYGVACAHQHSCSVLLARVDQFAYTDPQTGKRRWRTWINYEKFQELAQRHAEDPTFSYGVEDYSEDTPEWALFGSEAEGFDPTETRFRRKRKHPKYTKFDGNGIPTHDHEGKVIKQMEREKLMELMKERKRDIGEDVSVLTSKGGEKNILDASLMFRGITVVK